MESVRNISSISSSHLSLTDKVQSLPTSIDSGTLIYLFGVDRSGGAKRLSKKLTQPPNFPGQFSFAKNEVFVIGPAGAG